MISIAFKPEKANSATGKEYRVQALMKTFITIDTQVSDSWNFGEVFCSKVEDEELRMFIEVKHKQKTPIWDTQSATTLVGHGRMKFQQAQPTANGKINLEKFDTVEKLFQAYSNYQDISITKKKNKLVSLKQKRTTAKQ